MLHNMLVCYYLSPCGPPCHVRNPGPVLATSGTVPALAQLQIGLAVDTDLVVAAHRITHALGKELADNRRLVKTNILDDKLNIDKIGQYISPASPKSGFCSTLNYDYH